MAPLPLREIQMNRAALVATVLLLSACGSGGPTGSATSPAASPIATPVASPTPTALCTASNRCLALVTLRGSSHFVVRDVTDISRATTVADLGAISVPQFAGATQVSYVDGSDLLVVPLTGSPRTRVASSPGLVNFPFAWSRDGAAAYLSQTESALTVHQVAGGKDTVIANSVPVIPGVGCESQFCPGTDSWDLTLAYSPYGNAISFVDHVASVSTFSIWSPSGQVLDASDSDGRFMAVWSGNGLYFRDDKTGVLVWRSGSVSTFMPSSQWIHPKASPAGGQIVYATKDRQGWHHVFVVDIAARHVQEIKKARSGPEYLTSRYLWYRGERACAASDGCPPGWSVVNSGKTYIYDLQTGVEYSSIITGVYDVWPRGA